MVLPESADEMVAAMAVSPAGLEPGERERWQTIYHNAAWALWQGYLSFSWRSKAMVWGLETTTTIFRTHLMKRSMTERALALNERYKSDHHTAHRFEKRWGQSPQKIKIRKGPRCLSRASLPGDGNGDDLEGHEWDEVALESDPSAVGLVDEQGLETGEE